MCRNAEDGRFCGKIRRGGSSSLVFPQESHTANGLWISERAVRAVSVLCEQHHCALRVVDCRVNLRSWIEHPLYGWSQRSRLTSKDFSKRRPCPLNRLHKAIQAGCRRKRILLFDDGCELLMFGEMGIGNTLCALLAHDDALIGVSATDSTGRGTD